MKDVRYNRYMRVWEGIRKFAHYPGVPVIGGMLLGALVAGLIALVLIYVVQPVSNKAVRGLVRYRAGDFTLWFPRDSSVPLNRSGLAVTLESDLREIIALLDVDPSRIPRPIDVFVHPDLAELRASIAKRKSGEVGAHYPAPLDLLVGENPRGRLAELVLAFGWGRCSSEILKMGLRLYVTQPKRNFHAVVAALPDRLFLSLPQLVRLEKEGYFPHSLYDQFDSPYSPARVMSLAAFKNLLDLSPSGETGSIPALEAASLVQFLINGYGGLAALRQAWGPGDTARLLFHISSLSLDTLSVKWQQAAQLGGRDAPDYERWRIYYLLASGNPDAAYAMAKEWYRTPGLDTDDLTLIGRCALAVGDFVTASAISSSAGGKVRERLGVYLTLYVGWKAMTRPGIRVLAPDLDTAHAGLARIQAVYGRARDVLSVSAPALPPRLTVFFYSDPVALAQGKELIPFSPDKSAVLHLLLDDDPAVRVAEVLPAYVWGMNTYSSTLRIGVAMALARSEKELVDAGCTLKRFGRWVRLSLAEIGTADTPIVETEAGLMITYLLHKFGPDKLRQLWVLTSPLGRYLALDTAIADVYELTRDQIGEAIAQSFLKCG